MNPIRTLLLLLSLFILATTHAQKIIPDKPLLSQTDFKLDSLPYSEINLPIQIDLKPIYLMAEKNVDTLFSSPNWPDGWVESGCDTRYKYQFRRGPLRLKGSSNQLDLDFTGYYKIIGSTRLCVGGAVLSPWTSPCRCGFAEGDRRVEVGFTSKLAIQSNYKLLNSVIRKEPVAVDKCTVCFWGQDITDQVMKGMASELDLSKKAITDSFGVVDLKPQVQQFWNQLSASYNLNGLGWLKMNPQSLRLNRFVIRNDSLNLALGLVARPVISFEKPEDLPTLVPNLSAASVKGGFNIFLDAVLNYDSLSQLLNQQMIGKTFDLNKGLIKKKITIKESRIYGIGNEKVIIKVTFSGSNSGTVYLTGKPFFDSASRKLAISEVDFDIKTRAFLLKSAEWLFSKKIIQSIEENSRFDLGSYIDSAMAMANQQINREWVKGISSYGQLDRLTMVGIYPLSDKLVIRSNLGGQLAVKVGTIEF
ncbi:MAG: DUF4403 family protein [Chitinophagales bacterium]|nr:DUF4403 family protein [Chitinophagales bacterium]